MLWSSGHQTSLLVVKKAIGVHSKKASSANLHSNSCSFALNYITFCLSFSWTMPIVIESAAAPPDLLSIFFSRSLLLVKRIPFFNQRLVFFPVLVAWHKSSSTFFGTHIMKFAIVAGMSKHSCAKMIEDLDDFRFPFDFIQDKGVLEYARNK